MDTPVATHSEELSSGRRPSQSLRFHKRAELAGMNLLPQRWQCRSCEHVAMRTSTFTSFGHDSACAPADHSQLCCVQAVQVSAPLRGAQWSAAQGLCRRAPLAPVLQRKSESSGHSRYQSLLGCSTAHVWTTVTAVAGTGAQCTRVHDHRGIKTKIVMVAQVGWMFGMHMLPDVWC